MHAPVFHEVVLVRVEVRAAAPMEVQRHRICCAGIAAGVVDPKRRRVVETETAATERVHAAAQLWVVHERPERISILGGGPA